MKKTSRMLYMALLVAQALVLYIFEGMLPVPFIAPGAKLGLANLITVIAMYTLGSKRDVFLIILLRLLLSTMFSGNLSSFMYSAAGATLSFVSMVLVKEVGKDRFSIIGVSACGAFFHNVGQLLVAAAIVENIYVLSYLPILSVAGVGTGIFIGITAHYVTKHMEKIPYLKKI